MNILYEMLGIDVVIRLENGIYYCGDNMCKNQEYAKNVVELQRLVDSLEKTYELLTIKERYLKCEKAIFDANLEKEAIKEKFKEYVDSVRVEHEN